MTASPLVFFHNPQSRATTIRALLEETGADIDICPVDLRRNEQLSPEYLAINPMGKVPAIRHNGAVVTETVAICIYLADTFREAGLAPGLDDPDRGPYLRWMVFYAACFEPAITDHILQREPAPRMQSPYADYATTLQTLQDQLAVGPWLLGERFSAADVLWGKALQWVTGFKLVEETAQITAYIERVMSRPAQQRAREADAALARDMGLEG